jgi:hypothetical protein
MMTSSAKKRARIGRTLSALLVLFLLVDSLGKLLLLEPVIEGSARVGVPVDALVGIGALEAVCAALFVIRPTAVLGALLLTAYLGGAVTAHVLSGTPFWFALTCGVLVWVSMLLRDDRLLALLPLRLARAV